MSAITPRISDIPKGKSSSDYKVCNIVDFRGINCAENPLDIKLGEASDMKNLYVNDELSLTTRPRLGWIKTLGDFSKILYDDGTILFGLDSSGKYKCLYNNKSCSFEDNSFDLDKWSIFKNSKGTYFLTCNKGYYYLDVSNYTFKNVIYSEEAYIPTTKIGKSFLDENAGTEYEQRNLLSKKYKESYLFNLQDTVIPNNFKNEKIDLKNVFEVEETITDNVILDTSKWSIFKSVSSPSGACSLAIYKSGEESSYDYELILTDYNKNKRVKIDRKNGTSATYYSKLKLYLNTPHSSNGVSSDKKNIYLLLGLDSNNNYNLHIIKTGYLELSYGADNKVKNTFEWIYITIDKDSNQIINWSSVEFDSPVFNYSQFKFYIDILDLKNNSYLGIDRNTKFEPGLMFFLKDDYSSIVYFSDVKIPLSILDTFKIYSYDFLGKYVSKFTKYSDLFIDSSTLSPSYSDYKQLFYYNNYFYYFYDTDDFIIQKGILDSTKENSRIQIYLVEGLFYGTRIQNISTSNINFKKLSDGLLLYNNNRTYYLTIKKSCPYNEVLNNQDSLVNIFNFTYEENLIEFDKSIKSYGSTFINFKDLYNKIIYYKDNKVYLTSDASKINALNDIEINLYPLTDLTKVFEAYKTNKKIVLANTVGDKARFITITYDPSVYTLLDVERSYTDEVEYSHDFSKITVFDDKYWFYRSDAEPNLIRYSYDTTGLYIPENSYDDIGDSSPITSMMQITDSYLGIFKENSAFTVTEDSETADLYYVQTLKTELGNVPIGQTIVTSYTNNPLVINNYGIYGLGQNKNILETDSVFYSVTDKITSKYIKIKNKQNIKTHNHRFYTYFYYSENNITKIWVLDNRFNAWYYWELPLSSIDYIYDKVYDLDNADEVLTYIWSGNKLYMLTTSYYGILGNGNDSNFGASDIIGYQDYLNSDKGAYKRIEWYWKTPPLILQTINYLKKIVDMSMLFADAERETMYDSIHHKLIYGPGTDYKNNLELFYDIKTYRKKSMLLNSSYKGHIDYVSNARVKPRCQKCDFAALTLYNKIVKDGDNITYTYDNSNSDNEGYNNGYDIIDKLNLIGLTFKVVLS